MRWIITRDHIYERFKAECPDGFEPPYRNDAGTCSVGNIFADTDIKKELPFLFKIYDDDGELYYEGRSDEEEFEPLDWATWNAGATEIHYKQEDGSWARL